MHYALPQSFESVNVGTPITFVTFSSAHLHWEVKLYVYCSIYNYGNDTLSNGFCIANK